MTRYFDPKIAAEHAATGELVVLRSLSTESISFSTHDGWVHTSTVKHWPDAISDAACDAADTKLKERDDVRS